jgi:hypothetical protein
MDDSPEVVKLLKYILFGSILLLLPVCSSLPLVSEPPPPPPFNDDGGHIRYGESQFHRKNDLLDPQHQQHDAEAENNMRNMMPIIPMSMMMMMPNNNDNNNMRSSSPTVLDKFGGSLCSIFKTFLEPRRRFQRCHVGQGHGQGVRGRRSRNRGPRGPLRSNDLNLDIDNDRENMARMMMMIQHQQEMINSRKFDEAYQHQNQNRNRLLDEEQINNSGEVLENSRNERPSDDDEGIEGRDEPNHRHPHENDDHDVPDPTKISQDRTMILVPERSCPSGQRRDA